MPEPEPTQSSLSQPVEPKFQEVLLKVVEESYSYGVEKYGTPLMTFNGRSELRDMAEELISGLRYGTQLAMRCQVLEGLLWDALNIMEAWHGNAIPGTPYGDKIQEMKLAVGYPEK
jgi:hypothetical protein